MRRTAQTTAVSVVCLLLTETSASAQKHKPLPVIPGAHGFGIETPAGSGRHLDKPETRVIKVTNLKTDGPGSLRAALEAEGPRVVVFEVSGNIDFSPLGGITIKHPYVTIAGQTAPSPGITLQACELNIRTHDVLMQHIRIRVGDLRDPNRPLKNRAGWSQWSERDNMKVDGERIVIDHCSFSWATDENVQSRARRVTFSNNLFTECLNSPKHHKGGHSKGLLILDQSPRDRVIPEAERDSRQVAVIGNLFAFNADRNPQAGGGATVAIINNLIFAATARPGVGLTLGNAPLQGSRGGGISATVVGNHYDNVPAPLRLITRPPEVNGKIFIDDLLVSYTPAERAAHEPLIQKTLDDKQFKDYRSGKTWVKTRQGDLVFEDIEDPWQASHMLIFRHWMGEPINPDTAKATRPPVAVPGLEIRPAEQVRDWVLATAGARPADRDPVDTRVIQQVRARKGGVIKSQEDVGGWPALEVNRRTLIPPDDPTADDDGDGYTNLEEWLHGFADAVEVETAARTFEPLQVYVAINGAGSGIAITAAENQPGIVHAPEVAMYRRQKEAMKGRARVFQPDNLGSQWMQAQFTFTPGASGKVKLKLGAKWFDPTDERRQVFFDDISVTDVDVQNPGFEREEAGSIADWQLDSRKTRSMAPCGGGRNGGKCARLSFYDFARLHQEIDVTADQPVTVTFWYRVSPEAE